LLAPLLNQDPGLLQQIEDLSIEHLIARLTIEALIAILPEAAQLDEQRLDVQPAQPLTNVPSRELGPVVRANMRWNTLIYPLNIVHFLC